LNPASLAEAESGCSDAEKPARELLKLFVTRRAEKFHRNMEVAQGNPANAGFRLPERLDRCRDIRLYRYSNECSFHGPLQPSPD
jgi:hypothetical protein